MAGQSGFPEERGQSESAKLCFPVPAFPSLIKNTSERNVEMRNGNNSNSTSRDMGVRPAMFSECSPECSLLIAHFLDN